MKKLMVILAAGIAVILADTASAQPRPQYQSHPQYQQHPQSQSRAGRGDRSRRGEKRGNRDRLSSQDQRLVEAIEDADSSNKLRRYLQEAVSSRSEEVRLAMVNALELNLMDEKGGRMVSDLAYFIADPSEEVSDAAFSAWSVALDDLKGERRARAIIEAAEILRGSSGGFRQAPGQHAYPATSAPMAHPGPAYGAQPRPAYGAQPVVVPSAQPVVVPAVR